MVQLFLRKPESPKNWHFLAPFDKGMCCLVSSEPVETKKQAPDLPEKQEINRPKNGVQIKMVQSWYWYLLYINNGAMLARVAFVQIKWVHCTICFCTEEVVGLYKIQVHNNPAL